MKVCLIHLNDVYYNEKPNWYLLQIGYYTHRTRKIFYIPNFRIYYIHSRGTILLHYVAREMFVLLLYILHIFDNIFRRKYIPICCVGIYKIFISTLDARYFVCYIGMCNNGYNFVNII